jgi:hypothetical protein
VTRAASRTALLDNRKRVVNHTGMRRPADAVPFSATCGELCELFDTTVHCKAAELVAVVSAGRLEGLRAAPHY